MQDDLIEGRLNDIPYRTSPPLLFVYSEKVTLAAGAYDWPLGQKAVFTPSRPINANSLYIFNTLDFACDIDEGDYQSALLSPMSFSMYLQSDGGSPALREPVPLVKYFNNLRYILNILGSELLGEAYQNSSGVTPSQGFSFNRLMGDVNGTLTQTPALIGKASVTATIVFTVQEVTDRNFIKDFVDRSEATMTAQNIKPTGVWS
jgi:hypothetical protein